MNVGQDQMQFRSLYVIEAHLRPHPFEAYKGIIVIREKRNQSIEET